MIDYCNIYIEIGKNLNQKEFKNINNFHNSNEIQIVFLEEENNDGEVIKIFVKQDTFSFEEHMKNKYWKNNKIYNYFNKSGFSLELLIYYIDKEMIIKYEKTIFEKINNFYKNLNNYNDSTKLSLFLMDIDDFLKTNNYINKEEMDDFLFEKLVDNIDYHHFININELEEYFSLLLKKLKLNINKIYELSTEYLNKRDNEISYRFTDEFKNLNDNQKNFLIFLSSIPGLNFYKNLSIIKKFNKIHDLIDNFKDNSNLLTNLEYIDYKQTDNKIKKIGKKLSNKIYKYLFLKTPDETINYK